MQKNEFAELCQTMQAFQVDVFCTPEHNLDTNQHHIKNKMHETTQKFFDHTKLTLASSTIPSTSTFIPGGTLMTMQGSMNAQIIHTGADPLGRWTYQTFACKNHHQLTIIMAYQPCHQSCTHNNNIHTLTMYTQQTSLLHQQARHCTPRQASIAN